MQDRCTCVRGGAIGVNGKLSHVTVKNQELAFWEDLIRVPTVGGHYWNTDESSGRKCPVDLSGEKGRNEGKKEEKSCFLCFKICYQEQKYLSP